MDEEKVVLAWKPPYDGSEAFLKVSARAAENLLKYTEVRYRHATEEEYERFVAKIAEEKPIITCHRGELNENITGLTRWEKRDGLYRHCSYCGCIHPDDLRKVLAEGGRLGGSDWKYGSPHKFYVYPKGNGMFRWYNQHLADIEEPAFAEFAALLRQYAGIEFIKDEEGHVMYMAPHHGYQR